MEEQINERWLQFAFVSSRGNVNKTALKFPFHADLKVDDELPLLISGQTYTFTCVGEEKKSNNDGTIDKIYVIATNHQ